MLDFNVTLNLLVLSAALGGAGLAGALIVTLLFRSRIRKLQELNCIYDLTQLFGSTEFRRRLPLELKRAKDSLRVLSLVLLDIDHFKGLNDAYGYRTGDSVLREFAGLLKSRVRHTDVAFRYKKGDEFAVLMIGTETSDALARMKQLQEELGSHEFRVTTTRQVDEHLSVTFSVGIVSLDVQADTAETFIDRAELALRDAKQAVEQGLSLCTYLPPPLQICHPHPHGPAQLGRLSRGSIDGNRPGTRKRHCFALIPFWRRMVHQSSGCGGYNLFLALKVVQLRIRVSSIKANRAYLRRPSRKHWLTRGDFHAVDRSALQSYCFRRRQWADVRTVVRRRYLSG